MTSFISKSRVILLLILAVTATGVTVWHFTSAGPSPSVGRVVTPGAIGPCTWFISLDSGSVVAEAMVGGLAVTPGDNMIAANNAATSLWNTVLVSNQRLCFGPGVFSTLNGPWQLMTGIFNTTITGVYGQTILQCLVNGCVILNVGNQNANDQIFHAGNITISDIVMDGGGVVGVACLGVATSQNVYVNHVILQNCFEPATGCLRVTNWNANQVLNKNIYIENSLFIRCKIGLTGTVNGYLRNSIFQGQSPGAVTALVDFSKGDIIPTAVNNLGNFCFCGNTIQGWTNAAGAFRGFQAVSNDTIANNVINGAQSFLQTTNPGSGTPPYFEGLSIINNYYSNSTGGIAIGYGHSIKISGNTLSLDSAPGVGSTAITVDESQDRIDHIQPKNVEISNNEIYKWGGTGMDLNFTDGFVSNNEIYNVNQANGNANSNAGMTTQPFLTNVEINGNSIISDVGSGAGQSRPINYLGGKNITLTNNFFFYEAFQNAQGAGIIFGVTADKTFSAYNNFGFNPLGKITNFISVNGIGLCGSGTSITASTDYPICGLPVMITTTGGTGVSIVIKDQSGNSLSTGVATFTNQFVPLGYKVNFGAFSVAPTVTVFGT